MKKESFETQPHLFRSNPLLLLLRSLQNSAVENQFSRWITLLSKKKSLSILRREKKSWRVSSCFFFLLLFLFLFFLHPTPFDFPSPPLRHLFPHWSGHRRLSRSLCNIMAFVPSAVWNGSNGSTQPKRRRRRRVEQHADATLASSSSFSSSCCTSSRKVDLVAFVDLSADHMGAPCALVHVGGTRDSFAKPLRSSTRSSLLFWRIFDRSIDRFLLF